VEVTALVGWRRSIAELYALMRREREPARAHEMWRRRRDELFRRHPQSPLAADDSLRATGLQYFGYDPELRFEVPLRPASRTEALRIDSSDGQVRLALVGRLLIPELGVDLDVWWLAHYGGGLFVPRRHRRHADLRRRPVPA
jgi:uncharacterized protein (DUF1684 family)